jgi:hypothetical protein
MSGGPPKQFIKPVFFLALFDSGVGGLGWGGKLVISVVS